MKSRRKKNKRDLFQHKKAIIVILLVFVAILLFVTVFVFVNIFFTQPQTLGGRSLWDGSTDINVLVGVLNPNGTMNHIDILAYDPMGSFLILLPENAAVNENGGTMDVRTIYAVENLSSHATAITMLERIVEENTSISLDGYVFLSPSQPLLQSIDLSKQKISLSSISPLWILFHSVEIREAVSNHMWSNFSSKQLYQFAQEVGSTQKMTILMPTSTDSIDGVINPAAFSSDIGTRIQDTQLSAERARISVLNGSGISGEASYIGGIIGNQGGIIDQIGDGKRISATTLYVKAPSNFPYSVKRLALMLHAKVKVGNPTPTSDITIVLGQNIVQFF